MCVFCLLVFVNIYVSDITSAVKLDSYLIYNVDDIFHFCYAKSALINPFAILNPYAKPLPTAIQALALKVFSPSFAVLRALNSFSAVLILFMLYLLCRHLKLKNIFIAIPVILTLTSPFYFLGAISAIVEPVFCLLLIISVLLFYKGKYLFGSLAVSLLPVTHQLGVIYAAIAVLYFLIRRKYGYCLLILLPSLLWIAANSLILGHSFYYTFLYPLDISPYSRPPENSLLPVNRINPFFFMFFLPAVLFFLHGTADSLHRKEYRIINLSALPVLLFITVYNIYLIATEKRIWWEFRYFIPVIPFVSLNIANGIKSAAGKISYKQCGMYFTMSASAALIAFSALQFFYLQHEEKVVSERLSPAQEKKTTSSCDWLNGYMREKGIRNVYLLNGGDITDKYVRRLWMYLDSDSRLYCLTKDFNNNDKIELFDTITYKFSSPEKISGIFVSIKRDLIDAFLPPGTKLRLIKEFPGVSLYFFATENQNENYFNKFTS